MITQPKLSQGLDRRRNPRPSFRRAIPSDVKYVPLVALIVAYPVLAPSDYLVHLGVTACIYSLVVLSFNIIGGFSGQLSLSQSAFFGVGAYTSAILTTDHGWPVLLGVVAGVVAAYLSGLLVGYPCLRLSGFYLAMATLAFCEIFTLVLLNVGSLTHGSNGISGVPPLSIGGYAITDAATTSYYAYAAVLALVLVPVARLRKSVLGRSTFAIKDDELAAGSLGVNVYRAKLQAFTVSAGIAGLAGGLYAHFIGFISPGTFGLDQSIIIALMGVIGGLGTVTGSVIGAVVYIALSEWLQQFVELRQLLIAAGIVVILLLSPTGTMGLFAQVMNRKPWRRSHGT